MGTESGLRGRVQGLSEAEFRERFGAEAQCRAALFALRWGKGWACPSCGHGRCAELTSRAVYQCNRCKHQVGLTAGTVFHWTKLPLTIWFLAIYHLTQSRGGMSSVELARRLGTRQPTAWLMKQKLMAAMEQRDAGKPKLEGRVEGGARSGGKRGRGAAGKGLRGSFCSGVRLGHRQCRRDGVTPLFLLTNYADRCAVTLTSCGTTQVG
jgi:Transposase zinc-ribbon domain